MKRLTVKGRRTRIQLVIPNQRWSQSMEWSLHPYAACSLIAMVKDEYEVGFLDANVEDLTVQEAEKRISGFNPDILGVSVLANAYQSSAFKICEIAKGINPETITIIGGVFVTTRPDIALSSSHVDYGIMGEGEYVFLELIKFILGSNDRPPSSGVILREGSKLSINPQDEFIKDLDALPLPDYSLVDYSKYSMNFRKSVDAPRALPYGKIITSRGCPIGCIFCQVENISGKKTRYKSVDRVIEEIQSLIDNFGIKALEFEDDNLLGKIRRAKKLFKRIAEKNWDLVWNAMNVSVFYLDEEMLDLMKASKCQYLSMAIESGSPRVLKEIIHKPVKLDHAKAMAKYARKIGIDTTALFVIGFPGETWDEIRQTIQFGEDLGTDYVKINVATAFPGTKLHTLALETNSIDPDFDYDNVHWGIAGISTDHFTSDQLTILRAMEWERINFASENKRQKLAKMMGVSIEELETIRRKTINIKLADEGP